MIGYQYKAQSSDPVKRRKAVKGSEELTIISDQVALDPDGQLMGNSFSTQLTASMMNIEKALCEAGSKWNDVIQLKMYVVNLKPEHSQIVNKVMERIFIFRKPPVNTLIGVQSLSREDLFISIDAVAAS